MINKVLVLVSIIFATLQGSFLPLVFLEGFIVVLIAANKNLRINANALVILFSCGLIFDLLQNKTLGVTPMIFGTGALALSLAGTPTLKKPAYLSFIAFAIDLARSQFLFGRVLLFPSLVCFVTTFLFFKFVQKPALGELGHG